METEQQGKRLKLCTDAPSGQFLLGVRQFNAHEWYACHETLEQLWLHADGEVRNLYQGIIQVAIALHHWRNGNYNGAMALLNSSIGYLRNVSHPCLWMDVNGLIQQVERLRVELQSNGVAKMQLLAPASFPVIKTVSVP